MDFVALRKIFLPISATIAVLSVVLIFVPGLNLGIDFVSGTSSTYDFGGNDPGTDAVNDALVASGHPEAIVQDLGEGQYFVRTNDLGNEGKDVIDAELTKLTGDTPTTLETATVGSSVADGTVRNAIIAVAVAALFVMLYIMYAFRTVPGSYRYAVSAVVALIHDVLIVLGVFAVLGVVFNAQVNAIFIVGILTVIGYSVNDTIVIFDRVRENVLLVPSRDFRLTVNFIDPRIDHPLVGYKHHDGDGHHGDVAIRRTEPARFLDRAALRCHRGNVFVDIHRRTGAGFMGRRCAASFHSKVAEASPPH